MGCFLGMGSLKEVNIQKRASKLETLANQAQKEMKNLLDDKKMDKSKHENFRQSFEEVHISAFAEMMCYTSAYDYQN